MSFQPEGGIRLSRFLLPIAIGMFLHSGEIIMFATPMHAIAESLGFMLCPNEINFS
jgi:hypothetical protein